MDVDAPLLQAKTVQWAKNISLQSKSLPASLGSISRLIDQGVQ